MGRKTRWIIAAAFVLVALRVAAPHIVKWKLNSILGDLEAFNGQVEDVDLAIIVGQYEIIGLELRKKVLQQPKGDADGNIDESDPFLQVARVGVGLDWGSLFDGKIVAFVHVEQPRLNVTKQAAKEQAEAEEEPGPSLREELGSLIPIRVQNLSVSDGEILFRQPKAKPPIDFSIQNLEVVISNLTNAPATGKKLPTDFGISALVQEDAKLEVNGSADALAESPTFDVAVNLRGLALAKLKDFTRYYADIDVEKGALHFSSELASNGKKLTGYAKVILSNLDIVDVDGGDSDDGIGQVAWEAFAGAAAELLEDGEKGRVATKIPLGGPLKDVQVDVWGTITSLLGNAFIDALALGTDNTVSLSDLW